MGTNKALGSIIEKLVAMIGYRTESERLGQVAIYTFYANYFNMTILLLLTTMNLSEQPFPLSLGNYGSTPDFDSAWFKSGGILIVWTMITNAFAPLIELVVSVAIRYFKRFRDCGVWNLDEE